MSIRVTLLFAVFSATIHLNSCAEIMSKIDITSKNVDHASSENTPMSIHGQSSFMVENGHISRVREFEANEGDDPDLVSDAFPVNNI